jgi:negative regulator of replication initiation
MRAKGAFEVEMQPQGQGQKAEGSTLGRMTLTKTFHGDLEATSRGEMLTAMTEVEGSAAYVAFEQVTGSLDGRRGTFVLHHSGTMNREGQQLDLKVVPDSASGELAGLEGSMKIEIVEGQHFYGFEYTIRTPGTPTGRSGP